MPRKSKLQAKKDVVTYPDLIFNEIENYEPTKKKPIFLELGMGKGAFLTTLAKANRKNFYIGVEIKEERAVSAAKKAIKMKLKNFHILRCDIREIAPLFEEIKVEGIFINCPDPWPKARHAKKRMTGPKWLELYEQMLKKKGWIQLKTDDPDFFQFSLESLEERGWKVKEVKETSKTELVAIQTEFERRWRAQGKSMHYLKATC